MKILVTGAAGQLGSDVMEELLSRGHTVLGCTRSTLDITDIHSVEAVLGEFRPECVINCAAWTAVDAAELPENREAVFSANALGPRVLAEHCAKQNIHLIHISTDYVFSGEGETPWSPDCREFGPRNVYGQSKLAGEQAVLAAAPDSCILRICWVYGLHGKNFVKTMLSLAEKYDTLRVVNDQIGTPAYTRDLARLLGDLAERRITGIYHATNEGGYLSWYDFAREIFRQAGKSVTVLPVTTEEYGLSPASRPLNSRMDTGKLAASGLTPLPHWQDALGRYLKELGV